jgi:hypothetical protein
LYCTALQHASRSTYHIWQQCNVLQSWQSARHGSKTAQAFYFEWFECWRQRERVISSRTRTCRPQELRLQLQRSESIEP